MDKSKKDIGMPHYRTPMTRSIEKLRKQGVDTEFQITEDGLKDWKDGKIYSPEDIRIAEHCRFEGMSDPDDMAIMYVVETSDGKKGIIVDAFGVYSDTNTFDFMKKIREKVHMIDKPQ